MKKSEIRYRLFYVIEDKDSITAKFELREAGIPFQLEPVDKNDIIRLERDFEITRFPALFSDRACWQGLPAIRNFILRWKRRR